MDNKQLRQFIIDNAVGDKDGSINAIMEAIDQYKNACVNDALGQNLSHGAGNTIPSLKPLNWEVHTGDMLRAKCPNSGADYLVGKSNDGGHFISEVRQHALWKKIEGEYDTIQAAKDACEHHRNQRLRDLLQ